MYMYVRAQSGSSASSLYWQVGCGQLTPLTCVKPSLKTEALPCAESRVTVTEAASRSRGVSTSWKACRSPRLARSTTSADAQGGAAWLAVGKTLVIASATPMSSPTPAGTGSVMFEKAHAGGPHTNGGGGAAAGLGSSSGRRSRSASIILLKK